MDARSLVVIVMLVVSIFGLRTSGREPTSPCLDCHRSLCPSCPDKPDPVTDKCHTCCDYNNSSAPYCCGSSEYRHHKCRISEGLWIFLVCVMILLCVAAAVKGYSDQKSESDSRSSTKNTADQFHITDNSSLPEEKLETSTKIAAERKRKRKNSKKFNKKVKRILRKLLKR